MKYYLLHYAKEWGIIMLNIPDEDSLTEDEAGLGSETDYADNRDEYGSEASDADIDDEAVYIHEDEHYGIYKEKRSGYDMNEETGEEEQSGYYMSEETDYEDPSGYDMNEETVELVKAEPPKKSFVKGLIYDLIFYAAVIFICLYIVPNFVIQRTVVDGPSMMNTLMDKDQLYVEKLSYHFNTLKRFDIIVFYPKGRSNDDYYVKRIIALPGEKVQIIGENIYINDELLEEDYGLDPIQNPGRAAAAIYLADDEYFVMGDNRSVSKDSRSSEVGNVKRANIGGRVILRIYPFDRFGFVD